jgi:type IV secretory pathway VirD2 relaxase
VIVRATGYVRGSLDQITGRLVAHLKYIQYRSHEVEDADRRLFTVDADAVPRTVARDAILAHGHASVAFHKLVLSPNATEAARITDWHQWTRNVMGDLATRQGQQLFWYAVKHGNATHPHVHVVLSGSGGMGNMVRLSTCDFKAMVTSGSDYAHPIWAEHARAILARDQDRAWVEREVTQEHDVER